MKVANTSTIRFRTTVGATAVVGVALTTVAIVLVVGLRQTQVDQERAAAAARAEDLVALLDAGTPAEGLPLDEGEDRFVQILDADGRVAAASPNVAGRPPLDAPGSVPADADDQFVVVQADARAMTVIVGREIDSASETVGPLAAMLAVAVPLLLGLVGATTWSVVGRALRPVESIRRETEEITSRALHHRITEPASDDEIARLAGTMNSMLDRIETSTRARRQFVSDAAHELRSPVATIRQLTEVAHAHPDRTSLPDLVADVHAENLRVQRLVDDLLLLARLDEAPEPVEQRDVDLDDLVLDEARRLRASTDLVVDTSGVTAARVQGDEAALARIVRNLVDNAGRHASRRVALSTNAGDDDGVVVRVEDDGDGIPAQDRERIFDRFVRLDDARSRDTGGSGLGLAIARELALRAGATILVADSPLGGARFDVRWPAAE